MKRTTIFLSDEMHKGLRYIALDHNVSMAELLRNAVENVYKDDLKDILLAREARKEHYRSPKRAVEASGYFHKKKKAA
mgnify:FL=1